ncbi:MAG: hypothetical protein IPO81_00080 [Kouleothrix sp.]|nr:hypothetical protein [Kouleothrix sp.]
MDTLLIIVLIVVIVGMALSMRRPAREPQIIYVVAEPEQRSGGGCLVPLVFVGIAILVILGSIR